MINFELDQEQQLIRDTVVSFARDEIRPHAREADEKGLIPSALIQKGWELGLVQSIIPEEFGGFGNGHSAISGAVVAEELAYGDLSIAMHLLAPRLVTVPVLEFGSDALKRSVLPRFCGDRFEPASAAVMEPRMDFDALTPTTSLKRDGDDYTLNGEKCLVPLGNEARQFLVIAGLSNGTGASHPQAVLIDRETPGLTIGDRERNMGLKALATTRLVFDGCKVPREQLLGGGDGAIARLANLWRVAQSAMAVGVARAAFDYARDYAKDRRAFGQVIAQKQAIAFMLADMAMEVDAMRLLTWEAAWKLDRNEDATREAHLAKRYAAEMALKITDNALQVLGGHGYIRDHLVELFLRNARSFAMLEGFAIA
ncbi:MAG: acyl-CoA dehydrogenase family protein [Deltaproteobacteria bacterium]|nr:acyl-CoA dehydrogenase family protein [Deltaproteobacteria bacterium]